MIGFHEILVQSIARAGGIEVPQGARVFPDITPPGILWRGGRALVRGAIVLAKAIYRVRRRQWTRSRNTPEATDPAFVMATEPRRDPASPDTDSNNFQAARAA